MGKLTAVRIKGLTEPGRYSDGNTLFLRIAPGGSKQWVQRIVIDGKRRDMGLGSWPVISLAEARRKAMDNRRLVANGGDPRAEKRRPKVHTFHDAAWTVYQAHLPRWKNTAWTKSWWSVLERHAMPHLGDMRVDRITKRDVLAVLEPIWSTKPETARRVRQRIRTVFTWAMAHDFVEINPAGEVIDGALPRMPKVKNHLRSMPYQDMPEAWQIIANAGASLAAKWCLQFQILTAVRPGEARLALWPEIDVAGRCWTIPADKMKAGAPHRVPLSDQALVVLERATILRDDSDLIFPSPMKPGRPLTDVVPVKTLRDAGIADRTTAHGFRASFRTWVLEQTDTPWAVAEAALAHTLGGAVVQAYTRSDLFERRRSLMQEWGNFVEGDSDG